ncbi:MAG: hypothetical protein JW741_27355, partial [Sedimentisphaerales bacterium]|nr:hypothetical protein [Sedimentisphaerales bacterium]
MALSSRRVVVLLIAIVVSLLWPGSLQVATGRTILVEAEGFENPGGWVVDQQSMDQMGSPYLLAHGFGVPVRDATTKVSFPALGTYRVW